MPRKPKSVYERIQDVENKIKKKEEEIEGLKRGLTGLYKEREVLEMNQIFAEAKRMNLDVSEAIKALNMYPFKQAKNAN